MSYIWRHDRPLKGSCHSSDLDLEVTWLSTCTKVSKFSAHKDGRFNLEENAEQVKIELLGLYFE